MVADSGPDVVEVELEAAATTGSGGDARRGAETLRGIDRTGAGEILKIVALAVKVGVAQGIGSDAA